MGNDKIKVGLEDLDRAPPSLPARLDLDWHKCYLELHERFTLVAEDLFQTKEEVIRVSSQNDTRAELNTLIKPYAKKAFWFMVAYCVVVVVIICLQGFHTGFSLPDSVLATLVGATAANAIGLVGMVLTGVFLGGPRK